MRATVSMIISILVWLPAAGGNDFFREVDTFFQNYVRDGMVDYHSISQNAWDLQELVLKVENFPSDGLSPEREKAFLVNAYNILVIKSVLYHYPINSPLGVEGFFAKISHKVSGRELTLDELEKEVLYEKYPDPRLHFVLVCVAKGCPPLKKGAFFPSELDRQLQERTKSILNDPEFIKVDHDSEIVAISEIFRWYENDFVAGFGSVKEYINEYREKPLRDSYELTYYKYDWTLNEKKK